MKIITITIPEAFKSSTSFAINTTTVLKEKNVNYDSFDSIV